ncbi:MAG TPA: histidinol dehydrogenase [Candidatus Cybelea sp.]|jgi:histidinol dehydrogenase
MRVVAASDPGALTGLLDGAWAAPDDVVAEVAAILEDVRERGDAAIVQYARRFDDEAFDLSKLRVPIPMMDGARTLVSKEIASALALARERIERFHQRQRQPDVAYVEDDGTRYSFARAPLRSVAVYASRTQGAAAVLMAVVPAKIAGVSRIAVLSPPSRDGVLPAVLYACALCAVDELYAVGGAPAIGAAAFGTDSIARVEKIVGRGGVRTTEAKRQVFGRCGIDSFAGPAELFVVADDGANSEYVVGELLAAAELPGVSRIGVISESRPLLEAIGQLIDTLDVRTVERNEFVGEAITDHCRLIEVGGRDELLDVLNRLAPAYCSLQVRDPSRYIDRIYAAGAIFVGDMTPIGSEYLSGISSVVPTAGSARFASTLSLSDFTRSYSVVENSVERTANDAASIATLAEFDGLPHHAQTARMRFGG